MNSLQGFIAFYMATPWVLMVLGGAWMAANDIEPVKKLSSLTWWQYLFRLALWPWYLPSMFIRVGIDIGRKSNDQTN